MIRPDGYATPEEAAISGFDARYARVVGMVHGTCVNDFDPEDVDHYEVELATNEAPSEYTYFVHVYREGDLWFEASSHN